MNILFDNLETLIDAPNGIEKARELILQLAIQGKLVKQDSKDEPASEMIQILKNEIDFENTLKNEYPYKLPISWEWIKFRNIIYLKHGHQFRNYDFVPKGIPVIKITQCKTDGTLDLSKCDFVDVNRENEFEDFKIYKDDVLMALTGGTLGKVTKVNKDFGIVLQNYRVGKFIPNGKYCDKDFTVIVIKSSLFQRLVSEKINAGAQPNIGKESIDNLPIPLPPLNEQKRIVEIVNSLMALLDELEEKRERRNQKRIKLNNASLEKLLTSKDDKELKTNWKRIEENFSTLYSVPENVENLKQAILQLAVQGKLTSEWRHSIFERHPELVSGSKTSIQLEDGSIYEPASELLKKIKKEKEKLIAEGKIRKQIELPPINDEEKPFELPTSWEWIRLGEITEIRGGKRLPYGEILTRDNTGYIYIRVTDMKNGTIDDSNLHYLTKPAYELIKRYVITKDDIYMTIVGATIGKCGLVPEKFHNMNLTENAVSVSPILINKVFLYQYLTSEFAQGQFIEKTKKVGVDKMAIYKFKNSTIPLPPLNEQKRIVEKVNELMSLCNVLEEKLTKKEATAEKLVGAVVNAVANKTNKPKDDRASRHELIKELIKKHPKALKKLI